jgi:hypothetical protein
MRHCDEFRYARKRLFRVLIVTLGLSKPGEKSFGGLADLLAGGEIDILLACLCTPLSNDFFADEILIVVDAKDLRDLTKEVRVIFATNADEAFGSAEESFFMSLRGNQLCQCQYRTSIKRRKLKPYLFKHTCPFGNLSYNIVVKDGLG